MLETAGNWDYHQQSHSEIGGDKRISQHPSATVQRKLRESQKVFCLILENAYMQWVYI
jgi:hypothetical protein